MKNGVSAEQQINSLRLKTSKVRFFILLCFGFFMFFGAEAGNWQGTIFSWAIRVVGTVFSLLCVVVFSVGLFTNRYDAILTPDGIKFGTFSGNRYFLWNQIRSIYVLKETTGAWVCLEVSDSQGKTTLKRLPDRYGMRVDELAKTILKWRAEHRSIQNN